jgi:hypothetical protein
MRIYPKERKNKSWKRSYKRGEIQYIDGNERFSEEDRRMKPPVISQSE